MARICYREKSFQAKTLAIIELANEIIASYQAMGYQMTLRQLYYQFVARNEIENSEKSYKRLSSILSDARYAGAVDWDAIEDRGRVLNRRTHWRTPAQILNAAAQGYALDSWEGQEVRPEVWVEKEALIGVIGDSAEKWDLSTFPCKGYSSSSAAHDAARRLAGYEASGQRPIIFYLGDHDPSGEDMTRDIIARMEVFGVGVDVQRLALNIDQVRQYNLPPQPTKQTDSRSQAYIERHGFGSWELDALPPDVLNNLIDNAVSTLIDDVAWQAVEEREEADRAQLLDLSEKWSTAP